MPKLAWYWHRFRAMQPREVAAHFRKKLYQRRDRSPPHFSGVIPAGRTFPQLPPKTAAPPPLEEALRRSSERLARGRWKAFEHLDLQVDDPPRWQKDYFAGHDLATPRSAFALDHRRLPGGADIKFIWELSRWSELVRLAQASYLLEDRPAAERCVRWLADWVHENPPYRGWNWISALETGLRLVQFTWIDALLAGGNESTDDELERRAIDPRALSPSPPRSGGEGRGEEGRSDLQEPLSPCPLPAAQGEGEDLRVVRPGSQGLRGAILPAHVWFTWRYHSTGSSANNHLIGELAGLILALTRWPDLERWAVSIDRLQGLFEREVLAQFAVDGGNHEQALNYHLFSWEFCWQSCAALRASGRTVSPAVHDRLRRAADFFGAVQSPDEPWDYGDSDNAFVTPFFAREETAIQEWRQWSLDPPASPSIHYWLAAWPEGTLPDSGKCSGDSRPHRSRAAGSRESIWEIFEASGLAIGRVKDWFLRFDFSPLGYLSTAAHGHLDALHLSVWRGGRAFIIDPGTGAYYPDAPLRNHLASWAAHNGPVPANVRSPGRLGTFLWSTPHPRPEFKRRSNSGLTASLSFAEGRVERTVTWLETGAWQVEDSFAPLEGGGEDAFSVCWHFAPQTRVELSATRHARISRDGAAIDLKVSPGWGEVQLEASPRGLQGICSPAFRTVTSAPWLLLTGRAGGSRVFTSTFSALNGS